MPARAPGPSIICYSRRRTEVFYPRRTVPGKMVRTAGVAQRDAVRELDLLERRLATFDRRIALSEWNLYTGRADERATTRWQNERARFLRAPELRRLLGRLSGRLGAPLLERRVQLLQRVVFDAEVEQSPAVVRARSRLQGRIVRFRPTWHGQKVGRAEVYDVLRSSPDRAERERAWLADEPLRRSLEAPLRDLIEVRNDLAHALGHPNFAALRLSYEGLSPERLRALSADALVGLPQAAAKLRAEATERSSDPGWAPWDVRFALEQRALLPMGPFSGARMVTAVRSALGAWGIPPRRRTFRISRGDLPFGGLTISVDVPRDVRILVHPKGGWEYYMVLFHEYGHAVHSASIDQPTHLLRTTDPGYAGFAEGIAGVFEKVAEDPNWLATVRGLDSALVAGFAQARTWAALIEAGQTAMALETELRLYEHPGVDPRPSLRTMRRRWFGYDRHHDLSWAAPFFVTHPVYMQSYLLAPMFRAQVVEAMVRATGGPFWPNPRAGPWLTESFLAPGARYDWTERLRDITGSPLSAGAFVRGVAQAG
ncbi:MAG: hypothetical protein L3J77_03135 [Thermoplasmata archaeon]|nr:hypothetical protein [Thermoplasmata archaeon]